MNNYTQNKLLPVAISGVKATRAVCGAHEISVNLNVDGYPLAIKQKQYQGIYAHAPSELVFETGGAYRFFTARLGILDTAQGRGAAVFRVLGDGRELYRSAQIGGGQEPVAIRVEIKGVKRLELIVDDTGDRDRDHTAWLGPQFN